MRPPFLLLAALLLVQCTDPYGSPRPLFGRSAPPYPEAHEQYRSRMREQDRRLLTEAYERGHADGFRDARAGQPRDPGRFSRSLSPAESGAYQNGYAEGYTRSPSSTWQPPGLTSPVTPPPNDPAYSQGYDYGLRDRVAGRPADPGAHVGRYDPRHRLPFERGYQDAYESAR